MSKPECVLKINAIVGECPTWDEKSKVLFWVDIQGKNVHRFNPKSGENKTFYLPEIVTSLSLCHDDKLLLSLRKSLVMYSLSAGRFDVLVNLEEDLPDNRCNDGKCDPAGNYWVGTMNDKNWTQPSGALYKFSDNHIAVMQTQVTCANGMGWSPDHRTMYFTDSFKYMIFAYDYDAASGTISNRREFVRLDPNAGIFPDGLTVDSEGCVWSAQVGAGQVVRYDSSGKQERIIQLPVPRVTSCAFGGEDLTTLYITSATETMTPEQIAQAPKSGCLFALQTEIKGLPANRYK